jgi:hypothetical protein
VCMSMGYMMGSAAGAAHLHLLCDTCDMQVQDFAALPTTLPTGTGASILTRGSTRGIVPSRLSIDTDRFVFFPRLLPLRTLKWISDFHLKLELARNLTIVRSYKIESEVV